VFSPVQVQNLLRFFKFLQVTLAVLSLISKVKLLGGLFTSDLSGSFLELLCGVDYLLSDRPTILPLKLWTAIHFPQSSKLGF
jgi:hypothetical protein